MEQDLTESPVPELEAPVEVLSPEDYVATLVKAAKGASGRLAALSTAVKNQALQDMADGLEAHEEELLAENEKISNSSRLPPIVKPWGTGCD